MLSANSSADHDAFGSQLRAGHPGVSVLAISDLERGRTRWARPDPVDRLADVLELDGARRGEHVALAARRPAQTVW